jgi:hypothetical protein
LEAANVGYGYTKELDLNSGSSIHKGENYWFERRLAVHVSVSLLPVDRLVAPGVSFFVHSRSKDAPNFFLSPPFCFVGASRAPLSV